MKTGAFFLSCLVLSVVTGEKASAQISGEADIATFPKIASRLCFGTPSQIVVGDKNSIDGEARAVLAEAILTEAQVPVSVLFRAPLPNGVPDDSAAPYGKKLVYRMGLIAEGKLTLAFDPDKNLRSAIYAFHAGVQVADQKALIVGGNYNVAGNNPFDGNSSSWTLQCPEGDPPIGAPAVFVKALDRPKFAIRKAPEDLGLSGDAAKEAGSFALGVERGWSTDENGVHSRDTTVKIDGTVGYQLFGKSEPYSSYAYLRYNLEKARTRPAAPLAPGATAEDDDTNVLQLGMTFDFFADPERFPVPLWVTGDAGYIWNFVDDSERLRFRAAMDPGITGDAKFCQFGSGKLISKGKLALRCIVRIETDIGHWVKEGRLPNASYDDHLALGGDANFSAFYATGAKSKVIVSASGRYLPVLVGKQADIWRYDLSLSHRHFFDFGAALDVGFTYQHGLNVLTLEKERKLTFGVGILY